MTSSLEHRSASPFVGNIMFVQKKHIFSGLLIRLYPLPSPNVYTRWGLLPTLLEAVSTQDLPALFSLEDPEGNTTFIFQGNLGPKLYGGFPTNGGFPQQTWVFLLHMIIMGCVWGVPSFQGNTQIKPSF